MLHHQTLCETNMPSACILMAVQSKDSEAKLPKVITVKPHTALIEAHQCTVRYRSRTQPQISETSASMTIKAVQCRTVGLLEDEVCHLLVVVKIDQDYHQVQAQHHQAQEVCQADQVFHR